MWGSLAERSAFTSDKEACFKWFAKVLHVALVFARNCGQCMLIHELEMFHVRKNWWIPVWLLTEKICGSRACALHLQYNSRIKFSRMINEQ